MMTKKLDTYDDLFEALLSKGSVTIKTTNPKAVRNGLQKAKATHNELSAMMGMKPEERGMVVAAVKGQPNHYEVRFKIPSSTFSIVGLDNQETSNEEESS